MVSRLLAILVAATGAFAGSSQFAVVDGVIGGVPKSPTPASASKLVADVTTTPGQLRVTENSGVCETTPGVYQASGYGDLTENESMWFWFFEARESPDTAPLSIWLNGGPGSSSMLGLFQENGPCRISLDGSSVTLNSNSWNNKVNMLYIDQPIGTGFSHGSQTVGTSAGAAMDLWNFMQIWLKDERFAKYQGRDFATWTESYGGHYGPAFASLVLTQNALISNGTLPNSTIPIPLSVLGIGDGLTDSATQYPGYLTYATSNPYQPLVTSDVVSMADSAMYRDFGCLQRINDCTASNQDADTCSLAQEICNGLILTPLAGPYDLYDVRTTSTAYPPDLTSFLTNGELMTQIGAESTWETDNDNVYTNFAISGDWMFTLKPELERVIDAGVRTVLYAGDADFIVNFMGVEAMAASLQTSTPNTFASQPLTNWTVAGEPAGLFKNAGGVSYVRFFGAGHEVPAYGFGNLTTGQAALAMFEQIMAGHMITST